VVPPQVRAPAANDAVFRWKLLAGAASLAAVMAVSWSVLSGAPAGAGGSAGPQLALMQPAPEAAGNLPSAVLVSTPQGPVIRDARLEQLLAEHRQYGGMSALQMPAGFLRDATFDAAPPR
jgi:sigma-E factor negative regulatory protein RseA